MRVTHESDDDVPIRSLVEDDFRVTCCNDLRTPLRGHLR